MKKLIPILFLFLGWNCTQKAEPQKPNVLFLFADDQRAETLGIAGNTYIQTPTLDQLAKEGTRFTNAYVMGGNHGAICMASRAMLFSGQNLFKVYDRLKGVQTMT
ncbi:MAG: sulfatase-like hydrolase/transferase, partial [Cyclobacteriaceae bacterium]|nr:sulfatase-like hydrolase/transferase [Cyclobacteriaceae bacterium]